MQPKNGMPKIKKINIDSKNAKLVQNHNIKCLLFSAFTSDSKIARMQRSLCGA
jgi:hypothetical protein